MAIHTGDSAIRLTDYMNPNDTEEFWMSWTDKLNGDTISTSTWYLPTNFTSEATQTNQTVTVAGTNYADANSVTVSTTETTGVYKFSNEITTAGGLTLRRSFTVVLDPCI